MIRLPNIDELKIEFRKYKLTLISKELVSSQQKLQFICDNHPEEIQEIKYTSFKRKKNNGCKKCTIHKSKNKAYNLAINLFNKMNLTILFSRDDFKNSNSKLKYFCNKHPDIIQEISYNSLKSRKIKTGCIYCIHDSLRLDVSIIYKYFTDKKYIPLFKPSEYTESHKKLPYICIEHPELGIQYVSASLLMLKGGKIKHCKKCKGELFSKVQTPKVRSERSVKNRDDVGYREWQKKVYKKYKWCCFNCGRHHTKDNIINAHHIFSYSDNPDLRLEISNGIALCCECHTKFHNRYGRGGNNLEQLKEFLGENKIEN